MKYYGKICFSVTAEDPDRPGIFTEQIVEKYYYGDIIKLSRQWNQGSKVNDDLNVSNQISILADGFLTDNFVNMRYIEWLGQKWKISNIDPMQYPRLILTIGGLYNE